MQINSSGKWKASDSPPEMNQQNYVGDKQAVLGSQYPSTILNQFFQQPSATQRVEAALHQQGLLYLVPNSHNGNSLIAAVQHQVQQQLVASLASPRGIPLLQPFQQNLAVGDVRSNAGLLSRSDRDMILQRMCPPSSQSIVSLSPQRGDARVGRDDPNHAGSGDGSTGRQATATPLSCLARGMSADHNSSTAYFEIPSYASHGQHLLCSHPPCRAAGVKFRYCFFCKKPVTKQNFRSRHLHSDLDKSKDPSKLGASTPKKRGNNERPVPEAGEKVSKAESPILCPPVGSQAPAKDRPDAGANSSLSGERVENALNSTPESGVVKNTNKKPRFEGSFVSEAKEYNTVQKIGKTGSFRKCFERKNGEASPLAKRRDDSLSLSMVSRRRRWVSLLTERPSNIREINAWIDKMLAVSDMTTPWSATESFLSDGTVSFGSSVVQQSRWGALLGERPTNNEGGVMTSWLVRILEVSCPDFDAGKDAGAATLPPGNSSIIARNRNARGVNLKAAVAGIVPNEITVSSLTGVAVETTARLKMTGREAGSC